MFVINPFVNIAQTLYELSDKVKKKKQEDRDRVANYLEKIAEVLNEISNNIQFSKPEEDFDESCERLWTYSWHLRTSLQDLVGKDLAKKLWEQLDEANHLPGRYLWYVGMSAYRPEAISTSEELKASTEARRLNKAAGLFRATADQLRLPK